MLQAYGRVLMSSLPLEEKSASFRGYLLGYLNPFCSYYYTRVCMYNSVVQLGDNDFKHLVCATHGAWHIFRGWVELHSRCSGCLFLFTFTDGKNRLNEGKECAQGHAAFKRCDAVWFQSCFLPALIPSCFFQTSLQVNNEWLYVRDGMLFYEAGFAVLNPKISSFYPLGRGSQFWISRWKIKP